MNFAVITNVVLKRVHRIKLNLSCQNYRKYVKQSNDFLEKYVVFSSKTIPDLDLSYKMDLCI